jgi:RND superfamily putative drug exporter
MRAYAWLVVKLRLVIPLAWIAAAVVATISLPDLGSTGSAPLDDLVSADGAAAQQQLAATKTFGFPLYSDTMVVQRDAQGLPAGTQQQDLDAALAVHDRTTPDIPQLRAALPISDAFKAPLRPGGKATTALSYLFFDDAASLDDRTAMAERYAARYLHDQAVVGTTGAAPARLAQYNEIENALPIVEIASVLLILLIVGLAFRSLGAPLVTLFAAGVAYAVAVRVLPWAGDKAGASVPAEVEPIIIVLLLGLVTDYSVFFLSETRRRLRAQDSRIDAVTAATRRTAPIVLTAGLIVAAGTGALVVGKLGFFRAFGPGLALTTLIALAVAVTLVPALLALFGERLFGGRLELAEAPEDEQPQERITRRPMVALHRTRALAEKAQTSRWRLVIARVVSAPPIALAIAILCIAVLGALATETTKTELGLGFISGLPKSNSVHRAADAAAAGFAPGIVSPTEIDVSAPGIATRDFGRLEDAIGHQPGVAAVIGPREQPPAPVPQVLETADGNHARLAVIFDSDPLGAPAVHRLQDLKAQLPGLLRQSGLGAPQTLVGGETEVAHETVQGVLSDLRRIAIVALLVNLLLLMLFLRALIAPLYLVGVSVLGLAASLGITTFFFQGVLGQDDVTYYVPFAAAVLLVALGSDYNVLVAGRIWEQARTMRLREAIAVATPSAAKAVTVAGIALAASFALLVIVPLRAFHEFAFVMAVGVLVDTFLVRSLLVPALTSLFGELAWWPGRRMRKLSADRLVEEIASRTQLTYDEAELLTEGTLGALAERITPRERRQLARYLPTSLAPTLDRGGSERFSADEFLRRAKARSGGDTVSDEQMRDYATAVLTTLEEEAPDDLAYVRAQLSEDYDELFDGRGTP